MPDSKPTTDPISKVEFGQMMEKLENIGSAVTRIERIIIGNGSPGLSERNALLESRFMDMQATTERVKNFVYGIMGTVSLGVLGVLWGLLTHKITLGP